MILCFRTLDSTSALPWGVILDSKSMKKKAQECKKLGTKSTMKRTLVYSMRGETRRQRLVLLDLSWERAYQVTQGFLPLHMSMNDHRNSTSIDFGFTKNICKQVNLQICMYGKKICMYREWRLSLGVELMGHKVTTLNFWGSAKWLSNMAALFYTLTGGIWGA